MQLYTVGLRPASAAFILIDHPEFICVAAPGWIIKQYKAKQNVTGKFLKHRLRMNIMETGSSGIGNRIPFVVSILEVYPV